MKKKTFSSYLDVIFLLGALALTLLFTTVYLMPFRLDDVLHMDWAREHTFWDAFHPVKGEIVRSYRPLFAATIWVLTHTAGTENYFAWHITLVGSFMIGLAYAGLTARYLSGDRLALYFTTGFYWFAALPILNVLFWFGDLTFTIELMFTCSAWYFGLKGLKEGRIGYWAAGCILGCAAIASKEPAIVMVHVIFCGFLLLNAKEVISTWRATTVVNRSAAISIYLLLILVTIYIYITSPTRSNRFFIFSNIPEETIEFFIKDRFRYYSDILLNPLSRMVIVVPLVYLLIRSMSVNLRPHKRYIIIFSLVTSCILGYVFETSLLTVSVLLVAAPVMYSIYMKEKSLLTTLPFSVSIIITFTALMITVMLVKTQLTEVTVLIMVISGMGWSIVARDCGSVYNSFPLFLKRILYSTALLLMLCGIYLIYPVLSKRETLLRDVQAVRMNSNDAIKKMAAQLPNGSTVLVTGHALFGETNAHDLTSRSDEEKLTDQYTFLQGYVRSYLYNLGRFDLRVAYLESPVLIHKILNSFREHPHSYLFLQTEQDKLLYTSIGETVPIHRSDTSIIKVERRGFSSEVLKLRP